MDKLLNKFLKHPNAENAAKVCAYDKKHPMAECLLNRDYALLLNEARNFKEAA